MDVHYNDLLDMRGQHCINEFEELSTLIGRFVHKGETSVYLNFLNLELCLRS
jgi:hypothetical protein